jgi:glutaredoxin 3
VGIRNSYTCKEAPLAKVVIYTAVPCGYCNAAKRYFGDKEVEYEEIDLTGDRQARMDLMERTGQRTVPQIFIGEIHVGGYSDLMALHAKGEVKPLLEQAD